MRRSEANLIVHVSTAKGIWTHVFYYSAAEASTT